MHNLSMGRLAPAHFEVIMEVIVIVVALVIALVGFVALANGWVE